MSLSGRSPTLADVDVNITVAATLCKVNRADVEKLLKRGAFPSAHFDGTASRGVWMIPLTDLEAAGLRPDPAALKKHQRWLTSGA